MNVLNVCLRPKVLVALAALWLAISFIALMVLVWPFTLLVAAECAVCLVLLMGALEMVGKPEYANCNARRVGMRRGPVSSGGSAGRPAGRMRVLPPRGTPRPEAVAAHRRLVTTADARATVALDLGQVCGQLDGLTREMVPTEVAHQSTPA
jgi:hypothetical protein